MLRYKQKTFLTNPPSNQDVKKPQVGSPIGLSTLQDYNTIESQYSKSYPVVQLSKRKILVYNYQINRGRRKEGDQENRECDKSEKFKGEISKRTQQKIKTILETWIEAAKEFKKSSLASSKVKKPLFTFVTLTLSHKQEHSDNEIKRELLNHFLIWMQRETGVKNYIWKAETQKNGNIHFHIVADSYINHKIIRQKWNTIQNKLGYIDKFEQIHKHTNPNSTDIHSLKNIQNPSAYISKYICKSSEYRKIKGRVWSCTNTLSSVKKFEFIPDWRFWELLKILKNKEGLFKKEVDYCTIIAGDILKEIRKYLHKEYKNLKEYLIGWWQDEYFSSPNIQVT